MIIITEEQLTGCAYDILEFMENHKTMKGMTEGEKLAILGGTLFMLGQASVEQEEEAV